MGIVPGDCPWLGLWLNQEINDYPFDSKKVLNSWKIGDKIMVLLNHFSFFCGITRTQSP